MVIKVWVIETPFDGEAPDTPVSTTVHAKVEPGIELENEMDVALPEHMYCAASDGVTIGAVVILIEKEAMAPGQGPGTIVFVTVYAPGVLKVKSIIPVAGFTKTKPAGLAVKTPALAPEAKIGEILLAY